MAFSANDGTQPRVSPLHFGGFGVLDCSGVPPDLSLCVRPGDDVVFVCASVHAGAGWRGKPGQIYVAVHRGQGVWTHVYRVMPEIAGGRVEVFIEKVLSDDQTAAACHWARRRFAL